MNLQAQKNYNKTVNFKLYTMLTPGKTKTNNQVLPSTGTEITESEIMITEINSQSTSFNFLKQEPNLYSSKDLIKRYI